MRQQEPDGSGDAFIEVWQRASARQILECLERHADCEA